MFIIVARTGTIIIIISDSITILASFRSVVDLPVSLPHFPQGCRALLWLDFCIAAPHSNGPPAPGTAGMQKLSHVGFGLRVWGCPFMSGGFNEPLQRVAQKHHDKEGHKN